MIERAKLEAIPEMSGKGKVTMKANGKVIDLISAVASTKLALERGTANF
jgi:hypothetical protein